MYIKNILKNKTIKSGFWYTFGNIILKGISFLTLPIFTHILSTRDFGIYNTYIAYETILSLLIGAGLYGSVKAAKYDFKDEFHKYISSCISIIVCLLLLILIVINILYPYIRWEKEFTRFMINILIFHSFGSAIINFINAEYIIECEYKKYMFTSSIITILNIFLSIYLCTNIFTNDRYNGRIIGGAIPFILIGILLAIFLLVRGKICYKLQYYRYALKIGLPLIPHSLSLTLLSQFDRIMIQNMNGYSQAGIYSFAYTIMGILSIVMGSLDNAWGPWFYSNLSSKNYKNILLKNKLYVLLFTGIVITFMFITPEIVYIMADKEYWESIDIVIPLIMSLFLNFMYLFPVNLEYFYKKTLFISIGTIICAIVNIILNLVFLNIYGYKIAAYTTLLSNLLLFIIHWNISKKIDKNEIVSLKLLICSCSIIIAVGIFVIIFKRYFYIRYTVLFISILYIIRKNKNIVKSIKIYLLRGEKC